MLKSENIQYINYSRINDGRVIAWMPAKFAAKLIANDTSDNSILLKVDYEGGHGGGTDLMHAYGIVGGFWLSRLWQLWDFRLPAQN